MDKETLAQHIGRRIVERRDEMEMTQHKLSVLAKMSVSGLAALERGLSEPTAGTIHRIAAALEIKPAYFFEGFDG